MFPIMNKKGHVSFSTYDWSLEETALYNFMLDQDISIETVLDVIIKSNALVGVGIISLNDQVDEHLNLWIKYRGRS